MYVKKDAEMTLMWGGAGAFTACPLKEGDLVEKGIVRRPPVDGNTASQAKAAPPYGPPPVMKRSMVMKL